MRGANPKEGDRIHFDIKPRNLQEFTVFIFSVLFVFANFGVSSLFTGLKISTCSLFTRDFENKFSLHFKTSKIYTIFRCR